MSDKKSLFDPEKIAMLEFKMMKGQVDTTEDFDLSNVEGSHLDNSLQLGFNLVDNLVKADFTIEIKTESKGKNKIESTGSFHFVFIYKVENLTDLAKPDAKKLIEVDASLGNALSSITYSTARGILLTRLQGTALQSFILPVINPNNLLHNKK